MSTLGERLRLLRLQKGWNMDRLAAAAGISRTTLHYLERDETPNPHAATLNKIARALSIAPESLTSDSPPLRKGGQGGADEDFSAAANTDELHSSVELATNVDSVPSDPPCPPFLRGGENVREFDRATNPIVAHVADKEPAIFAGWTARDWDALYSTFVTGGALNENGVRAYAAKINRHRETLHRLHILLETHLADVATDLVDSLYRQVAVRPFQEVSHRGAENAKESDSA